MHRTTRRGAALAPVLALFLAACGGGADSSTGDVDPSAEPPEGAEVVDLVGLEFAPEELTVSPGTTVWWQWTERLAHNVVGEDFESPVQPDGTYHHTFEEAGEYPYECTLHPGMEGTIVVE